MKCIGFIWFHETLWTFSQPLQYKYIWNAGMPHFQRRKIPKKCRTAFHHFLQLLNSVLARGEEHVVLDQRFLLQRTGEGASENIRHQVKTQRPTGAPQADRPFSMMARACKGVGIRKVSRVWYEQCLLLETSVPSFESSKQLQIALVFSRESYSVAQHQVDLK